MNFIRFKTVVFLAVVIALKQPLLSCSYVSSANDEAKTDSSGIAILLVDTDRALSTIE